MAVHAFQQFDDMGLVAVGHILHLFPEVRHGGIGIVTAHGPNSVGIRTCNEDVLGILKRQHTIVLQQHDRLCGDVVGCLTLLGRIQFDILFAVEISILVEQSCTEFLTKHILHGTLQRLRLYQSLIDGFLEMLIVGAERKVYVVAAIDGCRRLLHDILQVGQLVDGGIVAHHHAVKTDIIPQDILKDLTVSHALRTMHSMIARHDALAACQSDHCLVGQQDFFHHFLFFGIATTAIAEVVLRTGTHTLLQVALLQALHKGHAHRSRQITILAIRLLQTIERGDATHVDHRRKRQYTTHFSHGGTGLEGFQFCQFRVEGTGLAYLLRVDGRA